MSWSPFSAHRPDAHYGESYGKLPEPACFLYLVAWCGTIRVCLCARVCLRARCGMQELSVQWRLSTTRGDLLGDRAIVDALTSSHVIRYKRSFTWRDILALALRCVNFECRLLSINFVCSCRRNLYHVTNKEWETIREWRKYEFYMSVELISRTLQWFYRDTNNHCNN